jgi:glycine/D-amino acid oxidase-like deaminating enzyme/nitrite reductase/ring-hydroxylating ferredoxin subunit
VCIVGAGIAGLSVGYSLAKAGRKVIVLDDGKIGGGQTEVTTAHLSNAIDRRYIDIEKIHGPDVARLVAESHTAAIDRIDAIIDQENIPCDFRRLGGYLFRPPDDSSEILDREYEAAVRTGALQVQRVDRAPIGQFDTGPCLCFQRQGQFHPLKYLAGLARGIQRAGSIVASSTHANQIEGGKPGRVEFEGGTITADAIVVATNTPVNDMVTIHTKQTAYLTYVICARLARGSVAPLLLWDTADPYHYVRIHTLREQRKAVDWLIVGGEDHRTGQENDGGDRFAHLENWMRERFPDVQEIEYRWSGQVMETIDGLAYIGRNPSDEENVYIVTGDCGQGMTHGTIAGMLISDLILGKQNPWTDVYNPSRFRSRSIGEFATEGANTAARYAAWVTPGEVSSAEEVKPGTGAIMRRGLKKIALYRNNDGQLTELSANCPHLGCIVSWNQAEQIWDCPCHGSRFSAEGKVLNGPANSGLAPVEDS